MVAGLAFIGSYLPGPDHFWWSYALLVIAGFGLYAPYAPFFAIIPELLLRNVAGGAIALVNSLGTLPGDTGRLSRDLWRRLSERLTGTPAVSCIAMGSAVLFSAVVINLAQPATERLAVRLSHMPIEH